MKHEIVCSDGRTRNEPHWERRDAERFVEVYAELGRCIPAPSAVRKFGECPSGTHTIREVTER